MLHRKGQEVIFPTKIMLTLILFMSCGYTTETMSILMFADWLYSQCHTVMQIFASFFKGGTSGNKLLLW